MPSHRDTGRAKGGKRSDQARQTAEDVLPTVVRSLLGAGLSPEALRTVFERTLRDWREPSVASSDSAEVRQDLDDLAHVLSVWHTDPRLVDRDGRPRRLRQSGRMPSFEALARTAIPSAPPEVALKRLLIAGVVEIDSNNRVRALRREFVTRQWDELGIRYWQQVARRYVETLEFNYTVPGEGRFERTARSERLPVKSLPLFNRFVREHGADFVQMIDDWLTQHEGQSPAGEDPDAITTGVGVYLFVDEPDEKAP
jgi:hypothetical protein